MPKLIIAMILFLGLFFVAPVQAKKNILRGDSPDYHVVVPGDTLWGIASKFLKEPWRWPEIWDMNREQVKNPHKIYPGDIIVLEKTVDGLRLRLGSDAGGVRTVKLSPQIHSQPSSSEAIPSIPASAIEPFLSQPLIIEKNGLEQAPYILGSSDYRVVLSTGDTVYVSNLPEGENPAWQVFRPGKALHDPDASHQVLGFEAIYLGNIKINKFGDISTAIITRATEEILKGDRLVPTPGIIFNNYAPHAPESMIEGRIISVYGGITEIGKGNIVTLNKGKQDGLEMGHVLAIYRKSHAKTIQGPIVELPDERTGLVFVFRVFENVSYALVVQSTQYIEVLDAVKTP